MLSAPRTGSAAVQCTGGRALAPGDPPGTGPRARPRAVGGLGKAQGTALGARPGVRGTGGPCPAPPGRALPGGHLQGPWGGRSGHPVPPAARGSSAELCGEGGWMHRGVPSLVPGRARDAWPVDAAAGRCVAIASARLVPSGFSHHLPGLWTRGAPGWSQWACRTISSPQAHVALCTLVGFWKYCLYYYFSFFFCAAASYFSGTTQARRLAAELAQRSSAGCEQGPRCSPSAVGSEKRVVAER